MYLVSQSYEKIDKIIIFHILALKIQIILQRIINNILRRCPLIRATRNVFIYEVFIFFLSF